MYNVTEHSVPQSKLRNGGWDNSKIVDDLVDLKIEYLKQTKQEHVEREERKQNTSSLQRWAIDIKELNP